MIDLSPLPDNATEADLIARLNLLSRICRPLTSAKGQNGVRLYLSEGNLVSEINTKELASIIDGLISPPTSAGEVTDPDDPGEPFDPAAFVAYEARIRGGTASLIGFGEMALPSTPPMTYLTKTLSGGVAGGVFRDEECTTPMTTSGGDGGGSGTFTLYFAGNAVYLGSTYIEYVYASSTRSLSFTDGGYYPVDGGPGQGWSGVYVLGFNADNEEVWSVTRPAYSGTTEVPTNVARLEFKGENSWYGVSTPYEEALETPVGPEPVTESLYYSGTSSYHPTTGALTNAGIVTGGIISASTGEIVPVNQTDIASIEDAPTRLGGANFSYPEDTALVHARPNVSGVGVPTGYFGLWRKLTDSTIADTLSDPDSEINAITRLLASAEGAWGAWTAVTSFPAAAATYSARTSYDFTYEHSQFRANYTGMPVGQAFTVKVRIVQVTLATGAVSTWHVYTYALVADGAGAATFTVDIIPAYPGYTYRVQSVERLL